MGLKVSEVWKMSVGRDEPRIDWKAERDTIDLAAVTTALLGPAPGRRGEGRRRLWWQCPFHEDENPSFCVEPGKSWWHCYGCGEHGDAATLLMKLRGLSFPDALAALVEGNHSSLGSVSRPIRPGKAPIPPGKPHKTSHDPPRPGTSGITPEAASDLVSTAGARLWTPEGASALSYLMGPSRGLTAETIRAARLGVTPPLDLPGRPSGIVLSWFVGSAPALVKIRQPKGRRPKYREAFRDRARLSGLFPGPGAIRAGRPLIVTEGEFDALLLGQELGDLAAVVTLGSASTRPTPAILGAMLAAAPWFIATDADEAGDKAAEAWPPSARRVRPPDPYNDWTEARADGVNLRRWWGEILDGIDRPPAFTFPEVASSRWSDPADIDEPPNILADEPPLD